MGFHKLICTSRFQRTVQEERLKISPLITIQWMLDGALGPNPKSLDDATVEVIKQLFFDQTGERYAGASVKSLPMLPEWEGNLVLLDENNMIRGLLWANKFNEKG